MPDGSVDFVLTDPPFNISKKTNFHTYEKNSIHSYKFDESSDDQWDTYTHDEFLGKLDEWACEWARVLKKGGNFAIFCADSYISHLMEALKSNGLSPRRVVVWRKNNAVPVNRAHMPMSANEYVVVGVKPGKTSTFNANVPIVEQSIDDKIIESTIVADKASTILYAKIREAILSGDLADSDSQAHIDAVLSTVSSTIAASLPEVAEKVTRMYKKNKETGEIQLQACVPNYVQNPIKVGNRIHPTEKPVSLLQFFVSLYSSPGDTVLDGFGGSGSTGEAAFNLGRNVILIEREEKFFSLLSERAQRLTSKTLLD